jgi:hypothetical protein
MSFVNLVTPAAAAMPLPLAAGRRKMAGKNIKISKNEYSYA